MKEESGLEFNPRALIAVEFQTFSWIRFTFVGTMPLNMLFSNTFNAIQ